MESLKEEDLIKIAIAESTERAQTEKMCLESANPRALWTDYIVTNRASGKSYRVALRGWQPGESFCSCPDFRKNALGTCKQIIHALNNAGTKIQEIRPRNTGENRRDLRVSKLRPAATAGCADSQRS
jgi:hypothetical protein